nr:methyltransferase dimerization domain-containing protein [uncultured Roseateles sp.]
MHTLSPERILQLGQGLYAAQTLVTAIELGLFTELGKGPRSARQLRRALGLSGRATPDLPDALVALGLLEREGDDGDAVYLNTRESSRFLDSHSAAYIGQDLARAHGRGQALWVRLGEALRTGRAQSGGEAAGPTGLALCWDDPAPLAEALGERLDFAALRRVVHLGGGRAGLSLQLATQHPGLTCCSLDLPAPTEAARARIATSGLCERVSALPLDLSAPDWPSAELLIVSLLHACTLAQKQALLKRARASLPATGALLVLDRLIDDERRRDAAGLLASLNLLLELGDAVAFSAADCKGWCLEAGFSRAETLLPTSPWLAGLGAVLAHP